MRLLRLQKGHDLQISALEATGAELDSWRLDLLDIVLDCLGVPADSFGEDEEPLCCRDSFRERFCEMGGSKEELRSFLEDAVGQSRLYYREHPEVKVHFPTLEAALSRLLQVQFTWCQLRDDLERAGVWFTPDSALGKFDLLPVVLDELGVPGEGGREDFGGKWRETVVTGSEEECLGFVECLQLS